MRFIAIYFLFRPKRHTSTMHMYLYGVQVPVGLKSYIVLTTQKAQGKQHNGGHSLDNWDEQTKEKGLQVEPNQWNKYNKKCTSYQLRITATLMANQN